MIEIENLSFRYKSREALKGISFSVGAGEIFGLLGPNGSGKTTLFRILSTLFSPSSGRVTVCGCALGKQNRMIREKIGVVFQSPSLDSKLTVAENLMHQGHLYGIVGRELKRRIDETVEKFGLSERRNDIVEKLSGGLKRRVELAKGLLHGPALLILDEPSSGLDPGARVDLWNYLKNLRKENQVTIVVTTHLMEEAERCDRVAILNEGALVALGTPDQLKKEIGGDVILVRGRELKDLEMKIRKQFSVKTLLNGRMLQIESEHGTDLMARLAQAFPEEIEAMTFRRPTLEDVFMHRTGHAFAIEEGP